MVQGFMGAQKKTIAYLVWLESNSQLFGFAFGLLGATQFGFWVAQHSRAFNFHIELRLWCNGSKMARFGCQRPPKGVISPVIPTQPALLEVLSCEDRTAN